MTHCNRARQTSMHRWRNGLVAALLALGSAAHAQIVSQQPLSAGGNVPGNLVLTPSVEWPTLVSVANIQDTYVPTDTYVGYFDSEKCYSYRYHATETERYFYPATMASAGRVCSSASKYWSGNYLNWATTQTIDPFRKALTGGFRSTDIVGTTILQKAHHSGQGGTGIFPDRTVDVPTASNATPATGDFVRIRTRISDRGHKMSFGSRGDLDLGGTPIPYDPSVHTLARGDPHYHRDTLFEVSIRVKVCDPAVGVESNCVQYGGTNWKPEGLMQKYANRMRYGVFGYLNNDGNDGAHAPTGAPLRAPQKFIGPQMLTTAGVWVTNPNAEWDDTTGIMATNPDSLVVAGSNVASTTAVPAITNSGAMNYLNKFGSMTTAQHKSHDPVSEMYWGAIRYLRNQGNLAAYSNLPTSLGGQRYTADGLTAANPQYVAADGFPVFSDWGNDPVQYYCQNMAILGIGDVYTWRDKYVPGSSSGEFEPGTMAAEAGTGFNAALWLQRISELEFNNTTSLATPFQGTAGDRSNSAYMAAAAYWAHTMDIRPEVGKPGKQTVSTYWVDVRENRRVEARRGNQYWLAAKYGGFLVDRNYDPAAPVATLQAEWLANPGWWSSSGETIVTGRTGDHTPNPPEGEGAFYASETIARPDNYYVGDQASKMVESLNRAFAKIASERAGSGSSLAANSTRLDTTTRIYQAQFRNGSWFGQLNAFSIDPVTGQLSASPVWRAGTHSTLAPANWASRNIWMHNPGTGHVLFRGSNLTSAQQTAMTFTGIGTATYTDVVNYLRGERTREESAAGGTLRTRTPPDPTWSPLLGDIVNSTPIFVGAPNPNLYGPSTPDFTGKAAYPAFATAKAGRTKALWLGANDGMLHGFNADTGAELYAFVPNAAILRGLGQYANPDYVHRYFVDGDLTVADVYMGGAWKTVLVGSMGRGGPGVFALDVTNPASPIFLWEISAATTNADSLGRNIGRPVIAQVANGDWRVLVGNGPDNANGDADLLVIDLDDGVVRKITSVADVDNGLSAVLARDTNGDGFADTAYAGDLKGKLWKFGALNGTGSATLMYTAQNSSGGAQPITAAPLVGRDPGTGTVWVFFGTGKYLGNADITDTSQQTWYGIKDDGTAAVGRGSLVGRTATAGAVIDGFESRVIDSGTTADLSTRQGWFIDLPITKERMVVPNRFQGASLIGTTRIPDSTDVCSPGGRGYIMAINPFTGARLEQTFFDMNRDGVFDDEDRSSGDVISGLGLEGMPNAPIFVEDVMLTSMDSDGPGNAGNGQDDDGDGQIDEADEDNQDENDERKTQGSSVETSRMSWREVVPN